MAQITEKKVSLIFQQENYDGEIVTLSKKFNDVKERMKWVKQARYSANYINKFFKIVSNDVNWDGSMKTWQDYAKEEKDKSQYDGSDGEYNLY